MSAYPIRPTWPVDIQSTATVQVTREGTSIRLDAVGGSGGGGGGIDRARFFTALEAAVPGGTRTLAAAVPSDPSDPDNRAFTATGTVTASGRLVALTKATLSLSDAQVAAILAQAATLPA